MKVEKLIIKDFRSHRLTRVNFTSGINLIVGQNGSGKSSLLDALLIGLYWPAKPRDLKKDDFLRIGGTSTEITVFFEKDGVKYQIHRNITRGISFVKYHDGTGWKTLESGQRQVREWMEKLIPYDIFLNAIYIRQGEIDAILESDESREKVVRQVLGLDRYENAYKNLLDVRKEIDARIKAIEDYLRSTENIDSLIEEMEKSLTEVLRAINELSPILPKLKRELKTAEDELKKLDELSERINALRLEVKRREGNVRAIEARVTELSRKLAEAEKRINELKEKVEEADKLREKAELYTKLSEFRKHYSDEKAKNEKLAESYRAQIGGIGERLAELEELKSRLGELGQKREELLKKLTELEESVKAYEEVKTLEANLKRLRSRLRFSPEKLKELERAVENARERKDEILRRLEEIREEKGALKSHASERNRAILELKKAKGKCPVCGRELTEEHRKELLETYLSEVKGISEKLKTLDAEERNLRQELVEVERRLKMERELITQRELFEQVKELEDKLRTYNVEELRAKVEEYEGIRNELGKVEGELKNLREELAKGKALERKRDVLKEKLRAVEEKLEELEKELESLGFSSVEELDGKIEELEPVYRRYLAIKDAGKELEKEEGLLSATRTELEGAKKALKTESRLLSEARRKLKELEAKYDPERHTKARERVAELRENLAKTEEKLRGLEERRDEVVENIKKLKDERERRKEKARELENLKKARERVQGLREKVKHYKNLLKEGALAKVGEIASEIFEELTEEKYSGITVKAEENKVKLGVVYNGKEHGLGFLSGGERITLGLAFRLALSLYLAGEISLLILDEPTPYLDEERRRRLVDIMQRYLRKIPQVIVVSHDEELKDAADRVIRVSLENGVSVLREVELGV